MGDDYNHLKNVVRMKIGETFRVSCDDGRSYFCQLQEITKESAIGIILNEDEHGTELSGRIQLFQGLPKGDKMELIIQKAVELGVSEIIPVRMTNCVVKLDDKKASAKIDRWQAIAEAAAKQSKRSIIPSIHPIMDYKDAVYYAAVNDCNLVPYENEEGMAGSKRILRQIQPTDRVGIFIGPEGGFDQKEIELVKDQMKLITLGRRILRTETAAIAAMSLVMMQME